ncbi:MAG: aminotransferase class I/II-fold pyridoxal phosphate-dependent enzyme [Acidimicrobiia bacterium]|nr:aminotransferase class I/II-fold pyridoxal phosphate-dependent enzyme [Acidimicrobiia bacterium]MYC58185.1 aminotransferase class I/II-fold pyridoxal phosphate-dependent enzyme [Acidimicrobiia bacterium]MYG94328.1 aminotransferase class I/II-fold pyridoxal phosphate-dependent enzyme [Acidimicrobiia bacterium]MYI30617.1 aminotransferase class I/II-fold pyridoxal phosphate-dependent enzyme [Acidimicrobiia bacterium]
MVPNSGDFSHPDTLAVLAGRGLAGAELAPTLYPTTTFRIPSLALGRQMALDPTESHYYTRNGNPTAAAFENAMAEMEGAEAARAFASGMGAVSCVVLGLCSTGDHIVAQRQLYSGTLFLLQAVCPRFGIEVSFVDCAESGAFQAAVRPGKTMLVFAETPANPGLELVDLAELGAISGPFKVVDSTFAPPPITRPLDYGVDLSLHSATKGIGGHNDATLGVVSGTAELIASLWAFATLQGANAAPFDAMNGLRGLRTLGVRLERQSASAQDLAAVLVDHPKVVSVSYPGLSSHPQHDLAARQMRMFGGLLSFDLVGGCETAERFVQHLRLAQVATSLGGPETLVAHPASTTHAGLLPEELKGAGIGPGTIRVSVGLEHGDDVVGDILQAVEQA